MSPGVGAWPGSPVGTRDRWFSREPSRAAGPRLRECRVGKGGPGEGPPRSVGRVSPEEGPWEGGRTGAVGVGLKVRGGKGKEMDGLRGWRSELQTVRASVQSEETCGGGRHRKSQSVSVC